MVRWPGQAAKRALAKAQGGCKQLPQDAPQVLYGTVESPRLTPQGNSDDMLILDDIASSWTTGCVYSVVIGALLGTPTGS